MSNTLIGMHQIAVNASDLANGSSIAAYLTSATGTLLTNTTNGLKQALDVFGADVHAEDSGHISGDFGSFALAVRNDVEGSLVSADGDYAPLQVDALGRLRVVADVSVTSDFVYAEDSPHVSGDLGAFTLLVRQDVLASSTSADGDYGAFKSNAAGSLYVVDSSANTTLSSILSELQSITFAEDSPHVSGDMGIEMLAVRNDTPGSLVSANGDYAPLQVNSTGALYVTGTVTVAGQYAEDSGAISGDMGMFSLAVRRDGSSSNVSAAGDYAEFQVWSEGSLRVVDISNGSILQQQVSVTSTVAAVPTVALVNRKSLMLQNTSSNKIWIGSASVTTSGATAGIELPANSTMEMEIGPAVSVFAIKSGAGSLTLNVLETA